MSSFHADFQEVKSWISKLLKQFEVDWGQLPSQNDGSPNFSDDRATLLFIIDVYNKHLFEIENQPFRKVRESLDEFTKLLIRTRESDSEKILFRLRQFFSSYRLDEYTYINKTFDEFKTIIWDFADQLGEDLKVEAAKDKEMKASLDGLREAVESNSINVLKVKAREFIDFYVEAQTERDERRNKRLIRAKKNLQQAKKKLVEANHNLKVDHLTQAFNRKSFEDQLKINHSLFELSKTPCSLIVLDIDFFKKINDSYGHDIGDFVLKECTQMLKASFEKDFVARIGGEEFAVILPDCRVDEATKRAVACLDKVRREKLLHGKLEIKFTVSMGIAELSPGESAEEWLKRADQALYQSKNSGRDRYTLSTPKIQIVAS